MRTLRLSLAGTVILALLGGLGGAAMAQDEGSGRAAYFTGTRLSAVNDDSASEWWEENGIGHIRGSKATETVEWSDPRLPSVIQISQNVDVLGDGFSAFGTTLLEGPEGYWTGEFIAYCDVDMVCSGMNTIIGHGAYEGLYAVIRAFDDIEGPEFGDWVFEGVILEGEMPPMPDPLEPSATE